MIHHTTLSPPPKKTKPSTKKKQATPPRKTVSYTAEHLKLNKVILDYWARLNFTGHISLSLAYNYFTSREFTHLCFDDFKRVSIQVTPNLGMSYSNKNNTRFGYIIKDEETSNQYPILQEFVAGFWNEWYTVHQPARADGPCTEEMDIVYHFSEVYPLYTNKDKEELRNELYSMTRNTNPEIIRFASCSTISVYNATLSYPPINNIPSEPPPPSAPNN